MGEQKIKQAGGEIGRNIRRVRLERGMGQTELVRRLQLDGVPMTRETLAKIERRAPYRAFRTARHTQRAQHELRRALKIERAPQTPRPWGE